VLILGATREAADDLCRELTRRRGASFGLHRFSLAQYVSRAAAPRLAARALAPASSLGTEVVAARAIFETHRRGELQYLDAVADFPGLPRALASTLSDVRLTGLAPDALRHLPDPGPDLTHLLREYEQQLHDAGIADRATLLHEAAAAIAEDPSSVLGHLPVLWLDVRITTPAERAVFAALASSAAALFATVPDGDEVTLAAVQRHTSAPAADATAATDAHDVGAATSAGAATGLSRLRTHLFSDVACDATLADDVEFFSAPGEGRECVEVARRVLREVRRGVPLDEMAVAVRVPELYWGLLEHALARAGVKAWYARGTRRPDPAGRAFLALLACAGEGLSARRFAEYLSLGQVPRREPDGGPSRATPVWTASKDDTLSRGQLSLLALFDAPAEDVAPAAARTATSAAAPANLFDVADAADAPETDAAAATGENTVRTPWKWESLLVESSVIGGADRWERRLDGLAQELRVRLDTERRDDRESPRAASLERDIAFLHELRQFALPIIRELAALPASATWGDWLDRLDSLAARVLRHPERVRELLAELRPLAAIGPVTLREIRQVITTRLSTLEREPSKHRYGRVFVGTPDQLRGRRFRSVFVLGLAERIFPQKPRQDPLLLDDLRRALSPDLATEDRRVRDERLLLRLAVGAATERLFVSYPRLDVGQARPRVPSFYALDIVRALTGRVPNYEVFEQDTAKAGDAWLAWPAPTDASDAIDSAEHDLAVLGPLLHASAATPIDVRGRAHYLLQLNDWLRRSLRTRWARWKRSWTPHDGPVRLQPGALALLASQRLTARPYSVSALQRFSTCPYQFLLGSIHRLEPFEQPAQLQQLDPLTKGSLFHEVQRDVLRGLKAEGLIPVLSAHAERARALLDEALDRVAARYHERLAPAIERVWTDEIEMLRVDLRTWIARMTDAEDGWDPAHFEFSFGMKLDDEHDPASVRDPVALDGGFLIRGAIDLIERHRDTTALRVTDHKTGKNRTNPAAVVGGGGMLQPVIYGLVVERVFKHPVAYARLYFATTAGGFTELPVSLREEHQRAGLEVLQIIDRAVASGQFPPAPAPRACTYCDFAAVCGPLEEYRFTRKDRDVEVVGDLLALRGMK